MRRGRAAARALGACLTSVLWFQQTTVLLTRLPPLSFLRLLRWPVARTIPSLSPYLAKTWLNC